MTVVMLILKVTIGSAGLTMATYAEAFGTGWPNQMMRATRISWVLTQPQAGQWSSPIPMTGSPR